MKRGAIGIAVLLALVWAAGIYAADFDGDGTGDVAIFRPSSGLWAVRGVTRLYFGSSNDLPVPGDYSGDGTDAAAIFRASSGLWAVRGFTRVYFGVSGDQPMPGDYTGNGRTDIAIRRASSGLWAVRGVTRAYFGGLSDIPIPAGRVARDGLLKTGQTAICRTGDDGDHQKGIAFSYQTADPAGNGEIVTIDNVTGLMWASDGNGKGCNWGNEFDNWITAVDWGDVLNFAGYNDWRLPNIRELLSLVNYSKFNPALDRAYFPNTVREGFYWSSTGYVNDCDFDDVWVIEFSEGTAQIHENVVGGLMFGHYVRAVRGGR